ncbi:MULTISPECIES: DUF1963 domain-containing protein [unclassified Paenibacillus]|uniref:DUF1963 domain-containing protein n=1 Tax=unclassified Paenibacillus TaxID=185978 RepID=UPI0036306B66
MGVFDDLSTIGRITYIANIGGFRPLSTDNNWIGGNFLRSKNEDWPEENGTLLIPILQLYVPDIEVGKEKFGDNELVQIFINEKRLSRDILRNGDGWKIIFHKSLDELSIVEAPNSAKVLKPFPIRWTANEQPDYPSWEESWEYMDMTEINESEELSDRFFDEFFPYSKTKIGGFASYIQSPISQKYDFILQISSEEKPGLMIGDNGNIYIYKSKDNNDWYLYWDCY